MLSVSIFVDLTHVCLNLCFVSLINVITCLVSHLYSKILKFVMNLSVYSNSLFLIKQQKYSNVYLGDAVARGCFLDTFCREQPYCHACDYDYCNGATSSFVIFKLLTFVSTMALLLSRRN